MTARAATSSAPAEAEPARNWRVNLAFIWFGVFVGLLGANFVFPFIPFYLRELGVRGDDSVALWTAVTSSVTGLSLFMTAPIWGSLADRFGRKMMFVRALLGAGIVIGLMGLVSNPWQLVALRFVMGAFAGTMGAAAALIAATTPRDKTGQALGVLQTAMFSANMLGPFIGGEVAETLGLREAFYFCAALFLASCLMVIIFVRESSDVSSESAPQPKSSLLGNLRVVLSERQVVVMLALLFCLWLSTTFVRPLLPLSIDGFSDSAGNVHLDLGFATLDVGEKRASSYVFAALGLTSTIAALSLGSVARRLGYRRCVAGAALATGLLFFPVAMATHYGPFLLAFALTGVFQGAMVPGMNALLAANTPEGKQGSAFGLGASMQSLALLVGPLAGGGVIALTNIHVNYALLGVFLVLVSGAALVFVREPRPRA